MKIFSLILFLFIIFLGLVFLRYRIGSVKSIRGKSEVKYQIIDLQNDWFRSTFESLFGNKRIYLTEQFRTTEWLYISKKDFKTLWPESPFDMKEKNYTISFEFETQPLFLGGFSIAKITSIEKIDKQPVIVES